MNLSRINNNDKQHSPWKSGGCCFTSKYQKQRHKKFASLSRLRGRRGSAPRRAPQSAKSPSEKKRRRGRKNSPVDCFCEGGPSPGVLLWAHDSASMTALSSSSNHTQIHQQHPPRNQDRCCCYIEGIDDNFFSEFTASASCVVLCLRRCSSLL